MSLRLPVIVDPILSLPNCALVQCGTIFYSMWNATPEEINNREFMLKAVSIDRQGFRCLEEKFCDDEEFVLKAVKQNPLSLRFTSKRLRKSHKIVKAALTSSSCYAGLSFQYSKIDTNISKQSVDEKRKTDKIIRLALKKNAKSALNKNPSNIEMMSDEVRNDREYIKLALTEDPEACKHMGLDLKTDLNFMLEIAHLTDTTLAYFSPHLTKQRENVISVVNIAPNSLSYACSIFQHDDSIFLLAIRKGLKIFRDVYKRYHPSISKFLKKEIIQNLTVDNYDINLKFVGIENLSRIETLELAKKGFITVDAGVFDHQYMNDKEIIFAVLHFYPDEIIHFNKSIRKNKRLVMKAISNRGFIDNGYFCKLPSRIKSNYKIAHRWVQNGGSMKHVSDRLKNNQKFVTDAIQANPWNYKFASGRIKNNIELAKLALSSRYTLMKYMPNKFKENREFVLFAVGLYGSCLKYAPKFFSDVEILLLAQQSFEPILHFARFEDCVAPEIKNCPALANYFKYYILGTEQPAPHLVKTWSDCFEEKNYKNLSDKKDFVLNTKLHLRIFEITKTVDFQYTLPPHKKIEFVLSVFEQFGVHAIKNESKKKGILILMMCFTKLTSTKFPETCLGLLLKNIVELSWYHEF